VDRELLKKARSLLLYKQAVSIILFGGATMVLLYKILHLSAADFGDYKHWLFVAFASICGLSFFKVRDLLAVRGLAILLLFLCDKVLDSVYCEEFFLRNAFVCEIYLTITFFMLIGAMPYIFRDCVDKILASEKLSKFAGCLCSIFAIAALGTALI
jgi:hypothetical protein